MDWAISSSLLPLSWLYGLGWRLYAAVYQVGLKRRWKPADLKIVGVGNLEAGGLGKTPATIALARILQTRGLRVAISASAYGSSSSADATMAPIGALNALTHGDEPALIRTKLPDTPLILGRDRVAAAKLAAGNADVLLLDDGYQHLPLARDVDLLLWDVNARNRRLIPAGPLREPVSGAKRASGLVSYEDGRLPVSRPSFRIAVDGEFLRNVKSGKRQPGQWLKGRTVTTLCAIARPERFLEYVTSTGAILSEAVALPDHDDLSSVRFRCDMIYVVTEKDAVKLVGRTDLPDELWVREYDVRFVDEEAIGVWLMNQLSR